MKYWEMIKSNTPDTINLVKFKFKNKGSRFSNISNEAYKEFFDKLLNLKIESGGWYIRCLDGKIEGCVLTGNASVKDNNIEKIKVKLGYKK